jgi:hypothetical protein
MIRVLLVSYVLMLSIMSSCKSIDPAEEVPAYLLIDTAWVSNVNTSLGSASSKITDAYVFVGNDFWGVFELPALIPYFGSDSVKIVVQAAVKENGISTTRMVYPFYESIIKKFKFEPLKKDTLRLKLNYKTNTSALVNEDFEAGNIFARFGGDTTLQVVSSGINLYEGSRSAMFSLDTANSEAAFTTMGNYVLSAATYNNLYLELNYRADNNFQIYFSATKTGITQSYYKLNITPKAEWSKIYINLTTDISQTQPQYFNILLRADLDAGKTNATIAIDNFKLLYN